MYLAVITRCDQGTTGVFLMVGEDISREGYKQLSCCFRCLSLGPICPLGTLSVIPYQFCYTIGPDALTFDQAAEYCKAKNANLAIFESIAELKLAQNLLPKER